MLRLPDYIEFYDAEHMPKIEGDDPLRASARAQIRRAYEIASIMASVYNAELDREPITIFEVPNIMARLIRGFRESLHGDAWDLLASSLLDEIAERPHEPI